MLGIMTPEVEDIETGTECPMPDRELLGIVGAPFDNGTLPLLPNARG